MVNKKKNRKTIGLALGSGGLRGFAHIGVLKVLEKHKIPIDYLSGASVGSWVAAYYALTKDIKRFEREILSHPLDSLPMFFELSLTGGFINGSKLTTFLEKSLRHHGFSATKIPLEIVTTDLISGQPFIFKTGSLALATRASMSVPLVFKPVSYHNKLLVDGGLSNPVPCNLVRGLGADIVIGINLYHKNEFVERKFTMPNIMLRSTRIVMYNLAQVDVRAADVIISPDTSPVIKVQGLGKYFTKEVADRLIKIGEQAAEKAIPAIKKLLAENGHEKKK
jgi:NTE family protein